MAGSRMDKFAQSVELIEHKLFKKLEIAAAPLTKVWRIRPRSAGDFGAASRISRRSARFENCRTEMTKRQTRERAQSRDTSFCRGAGPEAGPRRLSKRTMHDYTPRAMQWRAACARRLRNHSSSFKGRSHETNEVQVCAVAFVSDVGRPRALRAGQLGAKRHRHGPNRSGGPRGHDYAHEPRHRFNQYDGERSDGALRHQRP